LNKLFVIKIGGNIIDDEKKLLSFLKDFSSVEGQKILIHGGGKLATSIAGQMNVTQQMVEGRRITDAETLKIVTMVYAGYINKNIVARLQANGCNAIGMTGADGNAILASKRSHPTIDYGFAGDIKTVSAGLFLNILEQGLIPVIAPITHNGEGQLLNTNADTIAQEIAKAMSRHFHTELFYCFEKTGVLLNAEDDTSVIPRITPVFYKELKDKQVVHSGMLPKLDNAFSALDSGVKRVVVGKAEELTQLITGEKGTSIRNDQ
jgi:acetylglutamate kinase